MNANDAPLLAASPPLASRPVVPAFSTPLHLSVCEPPSKASFAKYFAKLSPLLLAHTCRCLSALAATDRPRLHVKNFYCCCRSLLRQPDARTR